MKHYEYTLKLDKDDTVNLKFLIGKIDDTVPASQHDIYIDNVKCEVKDAKFISSVVKNGTFDNGVNNWIHFKADWDGAYSTFAVENGEAKVHIDYEGPQNWSTQLAQEGLNIEKGKTYVLSFDAKSSIARNIQAIIEQNGGAYTKYLEPQTVALTGDMQHYTYEFTMNSDTDPSAHLVFALGKIDENASPLAPHDIFIDNVVIAEK